MMKLLSLVFFLSSLLSLSTAFSLRHHHARTRASGVLSAHDALDLVTSSHSTSHILPNKNPLNVRKRKWDEFEPEPFKPQPVPEKDKDKKLKRNDKLDEKCFTYSSRDQSNNDAAIAAYYRNLMQQRHPKKEKKGMFAAAVDAITADVPSSSMESADVSISSSHDVAVGLGSGVRASASAGAGAGDPGAVVALRAGGESLISDILPLMSTPNNAHRAIENERVFHGRLTVNIAIEYQIESGRAWTGDVVDAQTNSGLHRVRIVYGAVDKVLVFAPVTDTATHQLPAGVNKFRLIHEPKPTPRVPVPVPIATYHVTLLLGRQITYIYGVEIEDNASAVKLCHTSVGNGLLSRRMFQISSIDNINLASTTAHRRLDLLNVA